LEEDMHFGVMGKRGEILTIQWFDGDVWQRRESDALTFPMFRDWYKAQVFYQDRKQEMEDEAEHAATLEDLLDYPSDAGHPVNFGIYFLFLLHSHSGSQFQILGVTTEALSNGLFVDSPCQFYGLV